MSKAKTMMNCGSHVTKYWCEDYAPDSCDECPNWSPKKPPTNGDRIRAMTDEELAEWIAGRYPDCPPGVSPAPLGCDDVCAECWLEWLKKEADNA